MKPILLILLAAGVAWAQPKETSGGNVTAWRLRSGAALPTTCQVGGVFYKTGAAAGQYTCTATNTWTAGATPGAGLWTDNGTTVSPPAGRNVVIAPTLLPSYPSVDTQSLFIGSVDGSAGNASVAGTHNVCVGFECGKLLTTGDNNHAFGWRAGANLTTGAWNVLMGHDAGYGLSGSSNNNVLLGEGTGYADGTPAVMSYNTIVGSHAFLKGTNVSNTGVGFNTLNALTTGFGNTTLGSQACDTATTASENICIGYQAGHDTNTTGWHLTLLGVQSAPAAAGDSNETVIGFGATGAGSNSVTLGDTNVTKMCFGGTSTCWYKGAGVPAINCEVGSLFSRTDGGATTTLYVCTAANTWTAK